MTDRADPDPMTVAEPEESENRDLERSSLIPPQEGSLQISTFRDLGGRIIATPCRNQMPGPVRGWRPGGDNSGHWKLLISLNL